MPPNPWEHLYEAQSQPLEAYVLDEVAKALAKAVDEFPPVVEDWERLDERDRWQPVLSQVKGRPAREVVRLALKLYRWDLERAYDTTDAYMSTEGYREHVEPGLMLETALFLWRHWMDQTLAFKDYAQDKFRWSELVGLADRLESRLLGAPFT